jgi:glycosyltransferase involved in cell wall biosynthesis
MTNSPRGVLLLTQATTWRGSVASYRKIALGFARAGIPVSLQVGGGEAAAPLAAAGLTVRVHRYPGSGLASAWDLAQHLRAMGVGTVLADTPRDLRVAVLARLRAPHRVVYRYNLSSRADQDDALMRAALRRAHGIVFQSEAIRAAFRAAHPTVTPAREWLIPNGYGAEAFVVAPDLVAGVRAGIAVPEGVPLIVVSAALALSKGFDLIFAAMSRLPTAHLLVVGDGEDADLIRSLAAPLGDRVTFAGALAPDETRAALAAADVVVHGAEREIFPNVIAEAMALARPVVAINSWGTPEVVGDAGVLIPPGDAGAMAAAVGGLLADPSRRAALGAAAADRIRTTFPLERMERGYVGVVASGER